MYAVSLIYLNWSTHCFPFSSFQGKFFSLKGQWTFFPYRRRCLSSPSNLSIYLSPTSVTTRLDFCYHWQFNSKPSYFHHLAGDRVEAVHEEASLNENEKQATINHQLLVPRWRLARGSVPQMLQYIYTPPQNRPISGDAKKILPLTGNDAALVRARMPK